MEGKEKRYLKVGKKNYFKEEKKKDALWRKRKIFFYGKKLSLFNLYLFSMCWETCGPHMSCHCILPHHLLCHLITAKENLYKYPRVYTSQKKN
jgi:hypothetical protein